MAKYSFLSLAFVTALLTTSLTTTALAADQADSSKPKKEPEASATPSETTPKTTTAKTPTTPTKSTTPSHTVLLKEAKSISGLIPLYQKETKLYAEFSSSHYTSEYLVLISIARGIGQGMLLGGMTWGFGDDWVWKFRKVGKKVHIIRRNVRFKANKRLALNSACLFLLLKSFPQVCWD